MENRAVWRFTLGAVVLLGLTGVALGQQATSPGAASTPSGWAQWAAVIAAAISTAGALGGVLVGMFFSQRNTRLSIESAQRTNESVLWQKANESELKDLQKILDEFYGPYEQLSDVNKTLAREFSSRQPKLRPDRPFFMMEALFNKEWRDGLSVGDKALLAEICTQNAPALEKIILEKAVMVDEEVRPYLSRAAAHFRVLRLAHAGQLGTESAHFEKYFYPIQLDKVLKLERERLKNRLRQLREAPASRPEPMPALAIPDTEEYRLPVWYERPFEKLDLKSNVPASASAQS